jgi:NAD(P)H-quinone oxidoreductase subunit 5
MQDPALFPLLGPLALLLAGLWPRGAQPAAAMALATAIAIAAWVAVAGPLQTAAFSAVYADALSAVFAVLVGFVGLVIVRFSAVYLAGDLGQTRFMRWLCLTLAAVSLLAVSGNLPQMALAWVGVSVGLHRLLLFYPGRPAAVLAARKKFLVSRAGDACLIAAMVLLWQECGSLDVAVARHCHSAGMAAVLLACAAVLKSAQFPLHGWLLEVMETPTPVSALLHAGVINAGGFLVLRFAGVVEQSPTAMALLVAVGGITALFGAAAMRTQSAIKTALAYSTIAQMGFMLLECGLGAFSAAMLHIAAHGLYKAHAFLSSGSVLTQPPARTERAAGLRVAGAALAVAGLYLALQALAATVLAGALPATSSHTVLLVAVLALAGLGVADAAGRLRVAGSPLWHALHIHLSNGLYVNTLANRAVLRFWPAPPPLARTIRDGGVA